ncbi:MAG TPA: hypothetical protein P5246_04075 [Candidatus Omnitrophota bacterium]|jgi:hypothetical protein|nr:hypothetical protein [Candidatus Omnitrophota bacterium]HSA31768.1 hypothetical protein [Candidatus Omnitrophota bacterium]
MKIGLLGVLKLIGFICLLPVVIAVTGAFSGEIAKLGSLADLFWYGVIAYVLFHLFVFTPQGLYHFFQGIIAEIFGFSTILNAILPDVIPFLTTVLLLVVYVAVNLMNLKGWEAALMFFTGFSLSMHVVLTAQDEYEEDETHLKGHYLFHAGLMYITVLALVMALMHLCFESSTFIDFWNKAYETSGAIYRFVLHKLRVI